MSKLPPLDFDKVIKALGRIGYSVSHQRGSHIIMYLNDRAQYVSRFGERSPEIMIAVPAHKPLSKGMVRTMIREADPSVDESNDIL